MSVDWYSCNNCGETFNDCGYYVSCDECGTMWCSDECAEKEGFIKQHCTKFEDEEDCEIYEEKGWCDDECKYFVMDSCSYCRNEKFTPEEMLTKALELLGKTEKELVEIMKNDD